MTRLGWTIVGSVLLAIVVVPFVLWGSAIEAQVDAFAGGQHPRWIAALAFGGLMAADVLLPVPSSAVAVMAGMSLGFGWGGATILAGLSLGTAIGYGLGAAVGRPGLRRLVPPADLGRVDAFGARYGDAMVLVLRSVPVLAEASVITAGAMRVPLARFALWATVANALLSFGYAAIGAWAIEAEHHGIAVFGACAVPFVGLLLGRRLRPAQSQPALHSCAASSTQSALQASAQHAGEALHTQVATSASAQPTDSRSSQQSPLSGTDEISSS